MSNIIKGRRALSDDEKFVIDSNARVNAIFKELWEKKQAEELGEGENSGFTAGLNAPRIEGEEEEEEAETLSPEEKAEKESETRLQKLLGPTEYSLLKQEIKRRSDEVLADAERQRGQIMQQAIKEAKIKEQGILDAARESGYKEGSSQASEEYQARLAELEEEYQAKQAELENKIAELEPAFAGLVVKYVEKLTGILAAEDYGTVVLHAIDEAINGTSPSKYYRIHVPKEQFSYVDEHKDTIEASIGQAAEVEILSDATMQMNQCSIETDKCVIDCGLGTRLEKLTNSLMILAENRDVR